MKLASKIRIYLQIKHGSWALETFESKYVYEINTYIYFTTQVVELPNMGRPK